MKFLLACSIAFFSSSPLFAADQFRGFKEYVDGSSLKPFTRDLGGVLGSASFHNGRSLGFSGFDLGMHGGVQMRPSSRDEVLRRAGVRTFGLPWVQAEIGLPFRLDGFIRGISMQGLTIAGGGLRYGILKASDQPWTPQFLISTVAHSVVHKDFSASHVGLNLVASIGSPTIAPYVGVGLDRTRVSVKASLLDPTLVGAESAATESRFTAGLSVRPHPFAYVQAALTVAHNEPGFDAGFGIRF